MFPERIETDRLILERLTMDNLFEVHEHANYQAEAIDEITRHVTWSPHRSLKETRDMISSKRRTGTMEMEQHSLFAQKTAKRTQESSEE